MSVHCSTSSAIWPSGNWIRILTHVGPSSPLRFQLKCWSNAPASQGSGFESRSKLNHFSGHPRYYTSSVKKTARIISYYDSLIAIAGKKKHAFTQDSDDTRIFGAHSRVACAPSLSRVRVYFAHLSVCRPSKRPLAVKDYFNGFRLSLLG